MSCHLGSKNTEIQDTVVNYHSQCIIALQVRSLYILLPQAAISLSQYEAVHLHNDSQAARRKMSSIAESEE